MKGNFDSELYNTIKKETLLDQLIQIFLEQRLLGWFPKQTIDFLSLAILKLILDIFVSNITKDTPGRMQLLCILLGSQTNNSFSTIYKGENYPGYINIQGEKWETSMNNFIFSNYNPWSAPKTSLIW